METERESYTVTVEKPESVVRGDGKCLQVFHGQLEDEVCVRGPAVIGDQSHVHHRHCCLSIGKAQNWSEQKKRPQSCRPRASREDQVDCQSCLGRVTIDGLKE